MKLEFNQDVRLFYLCFTPYFSFLPPPVPRALRRNITTYDPPVILNDIDCDGSESSILDCSDDGYVTVTGCTSIAVAQCEGDVMKLLTLCVCDYNNYSA